MEQLLAQELSSSSDYAIAKIIKSIPADKRLTTGKLLVEVATTENVITKEQGRILERIFKVFEIPPDTLEKLIGQTCLRPRYDAVQDISNRPSLKWTLKNWRSSHAGDLIDDFTLSKKHWNFTDWKALNARWRALHEQLNMQQKQSANSQMGITKATPRKIKQSRLRYRKPVSTNLSQLTEATINYEAPKRHDLKEDRIPLFVRRLVFYQEQVCPHFTIGQAKKAAKELDAIAPGWRDNENRDEMLLQKAAELNPEWAEKEHWC